MNQTTKTYAPRAYSRPTSPSWYHFKSVFQCLYSQCDTAHFGSALHHIIAQCYGTGNEILFALPPIPNRDTLRRREAAYAAGAKLYGSGSVAGYPTESVNYPTQSVNYPTESVGGPYSPSPTVPYFPLESATSPAFTSAIPTAPSYSALSEITATAPILYTGSSTIQGCSTLLALLTTVLVIILTFWIDISNFGGSLAGYTPPRARLTPLDQIEAKARLLLKKNWKDHSNICSSGHVGLPHKTRIETMNAFAYLHSFSLFVTLSSGSGASSERWFWDVYGDVFGTVSSFT